MSAFQPVSARHGAPSSRRPRLLSRLVAAWCALALSMAPALALATMCDFADLDGPLLLADDYDNAARYVDGTVYPPPKEFWG